MMSPTTNDRMRWHAGLARPQASRGVMSVAAVLATPNASGDHLEAALRDLLDAMTKLNLELNGRVPSENTASAAPVPRSIAYAVAEINRMLREAADSGSHGIPNVSQAAWRVETAWLAVLAGDVDDLRAYLADEETMRHR